MGIDEMTKNARSKSVGNQKDKVVRVKVKKLKIYIAVMATAIGLAGTGVIQAGKALSNYLDKGEVVMQAIDPSRQFVYSETHRVPNNMSMYYYDTSDIADYIMDGEEELYDRLYGVFTAIGYNESNRDKHMTDIIRMIFKDANGESIYISFNDFLSQNGFVDKDGAASTKVYAERMRDYIYAKEQYKVQEENIKGLR